jgi:hypothetical protein
MPPKLADDQMKIACQQILLSDAAVFSVQWFEIPARYASEVSAAWLLARYFSVVKKCTCQLVQPIQSSAGVQFRVRGTSLVLLSFHSPQYRAQAGFDEVQLRICGGLLVQAKARDRGCFSLTSAPHEGKLRITVQLSDYCPLLLGSANPSGLRKTLYRITQAFIHKVVTVRYLSSLYRELTGRRLRARVNAVQVRQGVET